MWPIASFSHPVAVLIEEAADLGSICGIGIGYKQMVASLLLQWSTPKRASMGRNIFFIDSIF